MNPHTGSRAEPLQIPEESKKASERNLEYGHYRKKDDLEL